MKRRLCLVLALVLVVGMLSACGGTVAPAATSAAASSAVAEATATPAPAASESAAAASESATPAPTVEEEPYTIQVLVAPTKVKNSMDTAVGKVIYDKFKINFEFISYAGDQREKQNLMLAAGDFNEIQYKALAAYVASLSKK